MAGLQSLNGPVRPREVLSRSLSHYGGTVRNQRLAPLAGEDADMREPFEELVEDNAEIFEGTEELEDDIEVKVDEEPEEFEESEEQARTPKTRRSPKAPTKAEREAHDATHLPYRAWCHHCVRGRGAKKPHRR